MAFTIFDIYRPFMKRFRTARFNIFRTKIAPQPGGKILDIGGYPAFWRLQETLNCQIDCLNLHEINHDSSDGIQYVLGDGCALAYPDKSYDIVFSNSVIEHVGVWEKQQAFAAECRRVGRKLWVQTPAKACPIEPHYVTPFVHWLPKCVQRKILRWFTIWGLVQKPTQQEINEAVDSIRLLTKKEMRTLFPDCDILVERLLFVLPKSYIAIKR